MQHNLSCDNCDKEIITWCFGPDSHYRVYYTPPLQERLPDGTLVPTEYTRQKQAEGKSLMLIGAFSSILLCIDCVEQ